MRRIVLRFAFAVPFWLLLAGQVPAATASKNPHENFEVQKLAEGVYAVIRTDPPGLMVDGNCVFIVNAEDVVVVDAPEASKEILSALRKITSKPVRYVVNTHWHDDHVLGNRIWRDAFPGVEFIAHENTRSYLPDQGLVNRRNMLQGAPPFVAKMKELLAQNKNLSGGEMTPEERTSFASDIALVDQYLAEVPTIPIVLPTIAVRDRLEIYRGDRTIEILSLGSGHTAGDIVVHLPKETDRDHGRPRRLPDSSRGQPAVARFRVGADAREAPGPLPRRVRPGTRSRAARRFLCAPARGALHVDRPSDPGRSGRGKKPRGRREGGRSRGSPKALRRRIPRPRHALPQVRRRSGRRRRVPRGNVAGSHSRSAMI